MCGSGAIFGLIANAENSLTKGGKKCKKTENKNKKS